jgi:hypothetical protein
VNWPVWPDPAIDYANTDNWNNPKSIDDFWHTAVNGRGTFFSAKDPATVVAGLDGALNAINITVASGAGDAASSFEPTAGNNTAFTTGYQTGSWTGDLKAYPINLTSGSLETTLLWSANDLLDVRVKAACDTRNIYLIRPGGELTSGWRPEHGRLLVEHLRLRRRGQPDRHGPQRAWGRRSGNRSRTAPCRCSSSASTRR